MATSHHALTHPPCRITSGDVKNWSRQTQTGGYTMEFIKPRQASPARISRAGRRKVSRYHPTSPDRWAVPLPSAPQLPARPTVGRRNFWGRANNNDLRKPHNSGRNGRNSLADAPPALAAHEGRLTFGFSRFANSPGPPSSAGAGLSPDYRRAVICARMRTSHRFFPAARITT
jgi:hypothetical protein